MASPTTADFSSLTSAISALNTTMAASGGPTGGGGTPAGPTVSALKKLTTGIQNFSSDISKLANKLDKMVSAIDKTQKQFGLDIAKAAEIQIAGLEASIRSYINSIKSLDFTGLGDAASSLLTGDFKDFQTKLTQARTGIEAVRQPFTGKEYIDAVSEIQKEFGVINKQTAEEIAQVAKQKGVTAQALVEARRVFATQTMGDLSKVNGVQNKFLAIFEQKGLSAKVALESIAKYSELLARNGTRFAASFTRAAADAKKIGIDLNKVSQFGDSIISDFEGFLEKSAELGAMGFNLDSSRLAEISETGSDADLFNELRSQLAATGKDITNLRRSERIALEGMFGMNISEMQRLAGGTPEDKTIDQLTADSNSLLSNILTAVAPLATALSTIASLLGALGFISMALNYLTPTGIIGSALLKGLLVSGVGLATLFVTKYGLNLIEEGRKNVAEGKTGEGVLKGAAGGAAIGTATMAALITGLLVAGGGLTSTGVGAIGGIPMIAAALGLSALTGAGIGGSMAYSQGKQDINAPTVEANKKRQAEEDAKQRKDMQAQGFRTRIDQSTGQPLFQTDWMGNRIQQPKSMLDVTNPNSPFYKPPVERAAGGLVTGPGTAKSDSISARLSNGEFVINADIVKKLGLPFLNQINSGFLQDTAIKTLGSRALARIPAVASTAARFAKPVPVLGTALGGVLDGYGEYKKSNSVLRGIGKGTMSMGGGFLGNLLGGAGGTLVGGPGAGTAVGSSVGGASGAIAGNRLFDKYFPQGTGISGIANLFTGLNGDIRGAGRSSAIGLKGLAGSLLGKVGLGGIGSNLLGGLAGGPMGMLGMAAPLLKKLPFVGSALGAIAGGPNKLIGSALGKIGGLFGKKKESMTNMLPPQMQAMLSGGLPGMEGVNFSAMLSQMMGSQQSSQAPAAPVSVDTRGIEQKLNNFITALQGIQINMDGAQVGKVLVNFSDVAGTTGILRPRSSATF